MSNQLARQRLVSALVAHDSDPVRVRGTGGAVLIGVLVTVLLAGAAAVWTQLIDRDDHGWQESDVIVTELESGARFVWRDEVLHPVSNFVSAQLILDQSDPPLVQVSRRRLENVPRGDPLGLIGVPDVLPSPDVSTHPVWAICSLVDEQGHPTPVLLLGETSVGGERAVLVRDSHGDRHLLWQGQRHRIDNSEVVLSALGWTGQHPAPVPEVLLQALPAGAALAPMAVPDRGQPSESVPEAIVGEVVVVQGHAAGRRYAIVRHEGLQPLTAGQVDLVLSDPRTAAVVGQDAPRPMAQSAYAAAPQLPAAEHDGVPAVAPPLLQPSSAAQQVCVDEAGAVSIADLADRLTGAQGRDVLVVSPPGQAAMVSGGETMYLVSELGMRHAVSPPVRDLLGFAAVSPLAVPPELVAALPEGPALDPEQARAPVS